MQLYDQYELIIGQALFADRSDEVSGKFQRARNMRVLDAFQLNGDASSALVFEVMQALKLDEVIFRKAKDKLLFVTALSIIIGRGAVINEKGLRRGQEVRIATQQAEDAAFVYQGPTEIYLCDLRGRSCPAHPLWLHRPQ